ncbi:MAG: hypothetical protein WCI11_04330 [Candidatus Methylumidiphilus sp.]
MLFIDIIRLLKAERRAIEDKNDTPADTPNAPVQPPAQKEPE